MDTAPLRAKEAGFALFIVMIGLIVIGMLALGLVLATRPALQEARTDLVASEQRAFFDAVILQSSLLLLDRTNPNRPRIDGVKQVIVVLGEQVHVTVTSEFGKVDINVADANTLSNLMQAAGEGPAESDEEAAQIVQWRTNGGTQEIRSFRTVAELTQVPGISQTLYSRILNSVTVYSDRARVDESTAPLLALEAIPGMDPLAAQTIIRDRTGFGNKQQAGELANGQLSPGIDITGWAFTIESEFAFGGNLERDAAIIRLTGNLTRPYLILWREEAPDDVNE